MKRKNLRSFATCDIFLLRFLNVNKSFIHTEPVLSEVKITESSTKRKNQEIKLLVLCLRRTENDTAPVRRYPLITAIDFNFMSVTELLKTMSLLQWNMYLYGCGLSRIL